MCRVRLRLCCNSVHIFLDCPDRQDIWQKCFTACSLKDIFESVDNQKNRCFLSTMLIFLPSTVVFVIHVLLKLHSLDLTFISHFLFFYQPNSHVYSNYATCFSYFIVANSLDYIFTLLSHFHSIFRH